MSYQPQEPIEDVSKKDREEELKYRADMLISQSNFAWDGRYNSPMYGDDTSRQGRAAFCRKTWQNTDKSTNFDYLYGKMQKQVKDEATGMTEVIEMVHPAEVRHIPIVRPKLQSLISRILERPLRPRPYTVSEESVQAKMEAHIDQLRKLELEKFMLRMQGHKFLSKGLEMQQQLYQQIQQQVAQAQQQGQQVPPQMQEYLVQLESVIEQAQMMVQASTILSDEEREKVSNYYQYSYKDTTEQAMDMLLQSYIERKHIEQQGKEVFTEKMISDECINKIWWEEGMQEPSFEQLYSEQVDYPLCEANKNIRELDWCVVKRKLMYGQAIEKYGHQLSEQDIIDLRAYIANVGNRNDGTDSYTSPILPDGRVVASSMFEQYNQTEIDEYEVFWKEVERIKAIEREGEDGEIWYEVVHPDYKVKKGEKWKWKFRSCLYRAVRLGQQGAIYPIIGKSTWQPRPIDNPSQVYLPIVGKANSRFHQAHSLVWETRDIQELFNILHFQEETAIVLAGLRGIVYDISQLPENMELQEVIYYMKRGLLVIQSRKNSGGPNASFNQFQSYDQSVSPGVQLIGAIKQSLIDLVSMITGVTPQQQGQVLNTDQVGTYQMALAMSTATVEVYFQEHEWHMEQCMEMLANAMLPCYAKGTRKLAVNGIRQQIVAFPPDVRDKIMVKIQNSRRSQKSMERVQGEIAKAHQQGMINLSQYIQISDLNSLSEMTTMLKDFEEKATALMQQQQGQAQQAEASIQQQAAQLKGEMDAKLEQLKGQQAERMLQIQAQLDMQKTQMELGLKQAEIAQEMQIAQMDNETKRYDINLQQAVEMQYLQIEQQKMGLDERTRGMDNVLKRIELGMKSSDSQKGGGSSVKGR
jgi:hypothetical protein